MAATSKDSPPSMARIAADILHDTLHNIIHDILITKHREHKVLLSTLDPVTKLPHCHRCSQPKLLRPPLAPKVRGATSDPPRDTQYCELRPWSRRAGHDIYDNPFPKMDVSGRPPKPSKAGRKDTDGTPASNEDANGTAPPSPGADGEGSTAAAATSTVNGATVKLEKGEKKASKIDEKLRKGEYVPWQTCPTCKRSLLITRFAKHLEGCMGLSGRAASRNAMAKINGSGGSGATPSGSRGATPNPSQEAKGDDGDDNDSDEKTKGSGGVRKKVLKKGLKEKLKKGGGSTANGKLPKALPSKRPPVGGTTGKDSAKRDRDETADGDEDDLDTVHVKKRQKLQRAGSTTSMASQSTAAPQSAIDIEPVESIDGSFVDDGSGGED